MKEQPYSSVSVLLQCSTNQCLIRSNQSVRLFFSEANCVDVFLKISFGAQDWIVCAKCLCLSHTTYHKEFVQQNLNHFNNLECAFKKKMISGIQLKQRKKSSQSRSSILVFGMHFQAQRNFSKVLQSINKVNLYAPKL